MAPRQASFDFGESEQLLPLQAQWQDALEKAKANRTVFAQRRIKPDEVLLNGTNNNKPWVPRPMCSVSCKAPACAL